ncbi:MAG: MarR family winged helix-turn-helix transcriptional regulator [Christensenellales bacterium]
MGEFFNDLEFPILFSKISKCFNKKFGDYLIPYGLSKLHAFYLLCLYKHKKGLTLNQLNIMTGCDKANTSRAITDMEEKGIIIKINKENEKKYKVMLTEKGQNIGKEFVQSIKNHIKQTFSILSKNEIEVLKNVITKLIKEENI